MRTIVVLAFLAAFAAGKPKKKGVAIPVRSLKPRFVRPAPTSLQRSRTGNKPGLMIAGQKRRGLGMPGSGRIGFDLDGDFTQLSIAAGVIDGGKDPVQFTILGDGKKLVATPPLFGGMPALELNVDVTGVVLLELQTSGTLRSRAAWLDGKLYGAQGPVLAKYRATVKSFSPKAYPSSFRRKVNASIDRGAAFLKTQQRKDGTWRGHHSVKGTTALAVLAILKAGVKRTDSSVVAAFNYLDRQPPKNTYDVSVLLMAMEAKYFPKGANPKDAVKTIPERDQLRIQKLAQWLVQQQGAGSPPALRKDRPGWRYPHGGYDLSCTQYALFGLAAANRCGYATSKVWLPALKFILTMQQEKGPEVDVTRYFRQGKYSRRYVEKAEARGFGYITGMPATGSMTTAGICSLVLCRANLQRNRTFQNGFREKTRRAIRDALAWLEEYYSLDENPFYAAAWLNYYLFNLERAGVLLDQRYIGTRDWYREGCERYMKLQWNTGAWGGVVDTSFALLFMKKATVAPLTIDRR